MAPTGRALARFYGRSGATYGGTPRRRTPGWTVCDHSLIDGALQGAPIHEGTMDQETACALADALNVGTLTVEEVRDA